jgi:hypothetical protein
VHTRDDLAARLANDPHEAVALADGNPMRAPVGVTARGFAVAA